MRTVKFLKRKPIETRSMKNSGKWTWWASAAAKALDKKTTVHQLRTDLREIIQNGDAFAPSKNDIMFELHFDGEKFRVRPVEEKDREGKKTGAAAAGREFDPRERGLQIVEKVKNAEGGAWNGNDLIEKFGLSPAVLHRRRKEHRIIFWRDAQHNFFYPKWQFTESGALRPGIEEILDTFNSSDEWRIMRYFLSARHQLGEKRPLDLLRAGQIKEVLAHAKANAEEGSW